MSDQKNYSLTRMFGNLKVRPKLMVLHNLFFLVLACAAYFSLIPLFEKLVADARAREVSIVQQVPHSAGEIRLSQQSYKSAVARAKITLFLVLGSIYVLAVLLLESAIMPLYVYRPLRKMLEADTATQAGDRDARADSAGGNSRRRDRPDHAVAQRNCRGSAQAGRRTGRPRCGAWKSRTAW